MDKTIDKEQKESVKERILHAKKSKWIKFSIVSLLYLIFVIWDYNYWLLLGEIVIFDVYISKVIPWNSWKYSKNKFRRAVADWTDAILFALIAVYCINIFIFQMYKIPSSSLEKTLLVGDYLLVSKLSYGPRVPNTPLAFPLTHHTLPILNCKSYSNRPYWEYKRLKGLGEVKRNDIVVFNFPAGDTVALNAQDKDYYELVYKNGWERVNTEKGYFGDIVYRPVDRRENYVKRCIGMPGDSLQIVDNMVYIDGKQLPTPKRAQFCYYLETHGPFLTEKQFRRLGISKDDQRLVNSDEAGRYNPVYRLPLTGETLALAQKSGWFKSIQIETDYPTGDTYPYGYSTGWSRDNFGPVWIPKRGETVVLDEKNLALYTRCIVNYEGNTLRRDGDKIYINGTLQTGYTFKFDYYFMMGDNRHNSLDSRYWGFVPEDHIVGQPILIWMSIDKDRGLFDGAIRGGRLFRLVKNQ